MSKTISIIICTRNRGDILRHCLQSIVDNGDAPIPYEVVVVDNGSIDDTPQVVREFEDIIQPLKYIHEAEVGLSQARNRGAREASSDWLFYLDDDAKLRHLTLGEFCKMVVDHPYKLFSGIFKPWYQTKPPKWMKDRLVSYILKGKEGIRSIGEDYVSGGVMGVEKQTLQDLGMFNIHLGMTGDIMGYGEETDLQFRAERRGLAVGINTDLVIDHLVGAHKYKADWHIRSVKSKAKSAFYIDPQNKRFNWLSIVSGMLERGTKNVIRSTFKLVVDKDYFMTNWYIDNLSPLAGYLGIIQAKREKGSQSNRRKTL